MRSHWDCLYFRVNEPNTIGQKGLASSRSPVQIFYIANPLLRSISVEAQQWSTSTDEVQGAGNSWQDSNDIVSTHTISHRGYLILIHLQGRTRDIIWCSIFQYFALTLSQAALCYRCNFGIAGTMTFHMRWSSILLQLALQVGGFRARITWKTQNDTFQHLSWDCTARHLTSLSAGYYIRPPNGRASDTPACVHAQSGSLTYSSPKLRPSFDLGGSWLGCRRLHMTPDIYSPWPEGGFRSAGFLRGKEQLRICWSALG